MKIKEGTLPVLVLASIPLSLVGLFALAGTLEAPPERSGSQLCAEIRHEVDLSVEIGLTTQREADAIVARCYRLFGDK